MERDMARPEFFLRSYPVPDDMAAHAAAVERDSPSDSPRVNHDFTT